MTRPKISDLREIIWYDPTTGEFAWLQRPRKYFDSDRGWARWNSSYAGDAPRIYRGSIRFLGFSVQAAHIAWVLTYDDWPEGVMVHRNGDKSDFRLSNLEESTRSEVRRKTGGSYVRKRRPKKRSGKINYENMEAASFAVLADEDDDLSAVFSDLGI